MKRSFWAGALLAAAIAPWSVAQANGSVAVSVSTPEFGFTIGRPFYGPPVVPVPVYVPPPRVFVPAPVPVYAPPVYAPRVIYAPRPVFYPRPHWYGYGARHAYWHDGHRHGNPHQRHGHDH